MLPLGFSLSIEGARLSFSGQLQFQLTNSSARFLVQSTWQFSTREQTADWSTFPCRSRFGLVILSQLARLWLSFVQWLVGRISFSGLALLPRNEYPDLR
jgi:hypothetical protein